MVTIADELKPLIEKSMQLQKDSAPQSLVTATMTAWGMTQ